MNTKIRVLLVVLLALIVAGVHEWNPPKQPRAITTPLARITWIAHALGGVGGKDYTNSLEAFVFSYGRGFRVFEIDLMFTADRDVCAFHSLDSMGREFGVPHRVSEVDAATFRGLRYFGKYTPICLEELGRLMDQYPDALIVLDMKDSQNNAPEQDMRVSRDAFEQIYQHIFEAWRSHPERWQRIIPQIYHAEDLSFLQASHQRFHSVIYTLYRTNASDDEVIAFVSMHPEITAVTTYKTRFRPELAARLANLGRDTFVHTLNDKAEIDGFIARGATGFYTDFHAPLSDYRASSEPTE